MSTKHTVYPSLIDQAARDRFVRETGAGFSVIAPAGVGKTTAIVSRIATIAVHDQQRSTPMLPKLVLVTYTHKAANEMQERARQRLLEQTVDAQRVMQFNQAFFGTIHSFCLELLKQYGYLIGLPSRFSLVADEAALWLAFLRNEDTAMRHLPEPARAAFACYGSLDKALQLAQRIPCDRMAAPALAPCPSLDFEPILQFKPENARALDSIEAGKHLIRSWDAARERGATTLPLPEYSKGGKAFQEVWQATFQPLREWLATATLALAIGVARDFRDYRVARGQLTYDDMVGLARKLVRHPEAGPLVRSNGYRVILDEAQDTDREQFDVLLGVTGHPEAAIPDSDFIQPEPGRFSMVGDPQQSIFSSRADLSVYLNVHANLCAAAVTESLTFQVTMRCDQAVVNTVNALFPNILQQRTGPTRQVDYVPLRARPAAGQGHVQKIQLQPPADLDTGRSSKAADVAQAQAFAEWLAARSVDDFGVGDWSQAVILCPRNEWLALLAQALESRGVPVQVHSRKDILGDHPAYCWLTALLHVLVQPDDAFEIAGLLRELFGIADDTLATYVQAHRSRADAPHPLNLVTTVAGSGPVATALTQLQQLRLATLGKPLREAVHLAVDQLHLRDRLHALPDWEAATIDATLEQLLLKATVAEEQGSTLKDWSLQLEQAFHAAAESYTPLADHVQLFSCHKSKGLEWAVVLVPFFFKPISSRPASYPRFIDPGAGYQPLVIYDKYQPTHDAVEWASQNAFFENQRLCYVTLTRAARQCYIVDDAAFYKRHEGSLADCMQCLDTQTNRDVWAQLAPYSGTPPQALPPVDEQVVQPALFDVNTTGLPPVVAGVADARARAHTFIRRVLPSSLAEHATAFAHQRDERDVGTEPSFPEVSAEIAAQAGADYGNWWHATMEHLPWAEDEEAWQAHITQALATCPNVERGTHEWTQFMQSAAAQCLRTCGEHVRTELPLLWRSDTVAYDGYIDLVAYQPEQAAWILVDWKTDKLKGKDAQELLAIYGPQISAYVDALKAIFGQPVTGYLYSTRLGLWARVN